MEEREGGYVQKKILERESLRAGLLVFIDLFSLIKNNVTQKVHVLDGPVNYMYSQLIDGAA